MKTVKLDNNRNPVFENGQIAYLTGGEAFKQLLENYLQIFKGEWFLNREYGNDIIRYVSERLPLPAIASLFAQEILNLEYIRVVNFINLRIKDDTLIVDIIVGINNESFELSLEV